MKKDYRKIFSKQTHANNKTTGDRGYTWTKSWFHTFPSKSIIYKRLIVWNYITSCLSENKIRTSLHKLPASTLNTLQHYLILSKVASIPYTVHHIIWLTLVKIEKPKRLVLYLQPFKCISCKYSSSLSKSTMVKIRNSTLLFIVLPQN